MVPSQQTTVLLIDDHDLIRRGLAHAFDRSDGFMVVGQAGTVADGLRLAEDLKPQVVVTDVRLPDGTGLTLARKLRDKSDETGIIVLTMYAGDEQLFAAMEAGASAFVAKDAPADDVVAAARRACVSPLTFTAAGLADAMRRKLTDDAPRLSPREVEVLRLLADGLGVSAIAKALFVSESTAKTHISSIYGKLGVANRAQAIMRGVRTGLLADT